MKNKAIAFIVALLLISVGDYFIVISKGSIRTVEFLSIFVIGVLSGVLLTQIIKAIKDRNKFF
jgi:multisubunit Na+/H+ antiporter MnhG subunit